MCIRDRSWQDDKNAVIESGLSEDEIVVTTSLNSTLVGASVKFQNPIAPGIAQDKVNVDAIQNETVQKESMQKDNLKEGLPGSETTKVVDKVVEKIESRPETNSSE